MSESVFSISINEKVSRAAELMIENNTSRLGVCSLLGIITEKGISRVTLALKSKTVQLKEYVLAIHLRSTKVLE
jgi:CBS domain-containing protein